MLRRLTPFVLVAAGSCVALGFTGYESADKKAVRRAVENYVNGIYDVQPELIERSVAKTLVKGGYYRSDDTNEYRYLPMTYEQLHELAGTFNSEGRIPDDAPRDIVIFDVLDKTAAAKLTAYWGIDYFHLVKEADGWKITQVLWQSEPRTPANTAQ